MNRRTLLFSAGAAALTGCASSPATGRQTPLAAELDAAAARLMALNFTPGLSVAVFSRDGVYARGFGVSDLSNGQRADADTAFYIASSTKPLTALALAKLHQRRELNLDSTLTAYAPDAPFPENVRADEVTLRQMLCHISGIDNRPIGFRSAFSGQHDPDTLWRLLSASELNAEAPLGTYAYTNVGYNITTVLTDRKHGVRWQDLLDREVFAAAGMTRSSARMSRAQREGWNVAKPHQMDASGAPQRISLEKNDQTMQSAGGVIMSANDAARWLELMVRDGRVGNRQVATPEVIASTRAPLAQLSGDDSTGYRRDAYGLGWNIGPYRDTTMLHHFGGFAGFAAHVSYIPAAGVGVAAFANDSTAGQIPIHAIANYAYDRVLGHGDANQRLDEAIQTGEERRARGVQNIQNDRANRAGRQWTLTRPRAAYAGAYESETWGRIDITVEGEALNVRFGALQAQAEPFTQPDSVRVELIPGQGEPLLFQGEGDTPSALRNRVGVFQRV